MSGRPSSRIKLHILESSAEEEDAPCVETAGARKTIYKGKRKKAVQWTDKEIECIKRGVADLGAGKWTRILEANREVFHEGRTPVDLKDKYRQINGITSYSKSSKTSFVEIGEDGQPVCNAMGETRVYTERFPHNAAVKAGKLRLSKDVAEVEVCMQGTIRSGMTTRHTYRVYNDNGHIRGEKISSMVVD